MSDIFFMIYDIFLVIVCIFDLFHGRVMSYRIILGLSAAELALRRFASYLEKKNGK